MIFSPQYIIIDSLSLILYGKNNKEGSAKNNWQ